MDPLASMIIEKIEERIVQHKEYISSGQADNYSDYAGLCGVIKGMKECVLEVKEILNNSNSEDNF